MMLPHILLLAVVSLPASAAGPSKIEIPSRSSTSLFEGRQGKQKTEIQFEPSTGIVTMKLLVQDPQGYFIPNIRRDNFVVYENGVRQTNLNVEIERAAASLALLVEIGGQFQRANKILGVEVENACSQLLAELGKEDKLAIFKYGDTVVQLADFSQPRETLNHAITLLGTPSDQANLYDALIFTLERIRSIVGRKSIILISSGIDTFSKSKYEDVLEAVKKSDAPIYIIGFARIIQSTPNPSGIDVPSVKIDWKRVNHDLSEIAKRSGGRLYLPENTSHLSVLYDDILENLKVRYVIKYKSSSSDDLSLPRKVRVALADPRTGKPLEIVDSKGKTIRAKVIAEQTFTPSASVERRTSVEGQR